MTYKITLEDCLKQLSRVYHAKGTTRQEKTAIRETIQSFTGWHEKSVLRVLGRRPHLSEGVLSAAGGGRPRKLLPAAERALLSMWKKVGCPSGVILTAMLPDLVAAAPGFIVGFSAALGEQLLSVSASTIDRSLRRQRKDGQAGKGNTRPACDSVKHLRHQVEIICYRPPERMPLGCVDFDTVAHCCGDLRGDFAWTLNGIDVLTGWAFIRAVPRCRAGDIVHALTDLVQSSPFPIIHMHMDNGPEFMNYQMLKVAARLGITLSRSRAGHSNDNCLAEQANYERVRRIFGYGRYEQQEVEQMNKVNQLNMLIINLFGYGVKLVSKTRSGAKVHRVYDEPQTPLQRVIADYRRRNQPLPPAVQELIRLRETLNVFQLHKDLAAALRQLDKLRDQRIREQKKEKRHA